MSVTDPDPKRLVSELLQAQRNQIRGLEGADEILRDRYDEMVRRLSPAEPPKTEETTFGQLALGDEFLAEDGSRNRAVGGHGSHPALPLDGVSKDILWWPGPIHKVRKIVK